MAKKNKFPADKSGSEMLYREARFDLERANDDDRSIPIILATEDPIATVDMQRREIVNEVLRIDGLELPQSGRIPMLDSHNRETVRNVLGSIRDFEKTNGTLRAVAYFSEDAADIYRGYRDGHLEDFSVGAPILEREYKPGKNASERTLKTVTKSVLREGSAVVFGADPKAKSLAPAMRAYTDPETLLEEVMDSALKEALVKRGMPEATDGQDVIRWIEENLKPEGDDTAERSKFDDLLELARKQTPAPKPEEPKGPTAEELTRTERTRISGIDELCRKHSVEDKHRKEWIDGGKSVDEVARAILDQPKGGVPLGGGRIDFGENRVDKFIAASADGLAQVTLRGLVSPERCMERARATRDMDAVQRAEELKRLFEKPATGYDVFRNSSLSDIARMYLEEAGISTNGMSRPQIAQRAMRHRGLFGDAVQRDDTAYHTTGSFANLLLDAANKSLRAAYDEKMATYQMWVRQAASQPDFKQINRIGLGSLSHPQVVPENMPYPEATGSDQKESYTIDKYGAIFSVSWETVVNDDLDALSRIPAMHGAAMRDKINATCYGVLAANEALADGVALFHATSHGANLDTTALSETALDTGYNVMMTQTDPTNSQRTLNIRPAFLLVAAGISATADRLTNGGYVAAATTADIPLYGSNGRRPLQVIVDAEIDTQKSSDCWYLAADNSTVDTVEISHLQGYEAPVISREEGFETDTHKVKVTGVWGVKAIDYVGLYEGQA